MGSDLYKFILKQRTFDSFMVVVVPLVHTDPEDKKEPIYAEAWKSDGSDNLEPVLDPTSTLKRKSLASSAYCRTL